MEIPDSWFASAPGETDTIPLASLEHIELDLKTKLLGIEEKLAKARGKGAASFLHDPLGFIDTYVKFPPGGGLAPYQRETIGSFADVRRLAVRGPRGLGKSTTATLIILWFAITRDAAGIDWKVMTTAGSWHQLESYLWREIAKWARRIDWEKLGRPAPNERTELMKTKFRLRHGDADAASPDTPEKIEGAHADHIMLVVDEAKIVSAETFDAAEGILSGAGDEGSDLEAYALAISTPGEPSGRYYDIHRKAPGLEDWTVRHVTLDEAIAAGRMSRKWAEQRKRLWGENSALYQNHVLGEFCADDEDAIISLSWVEAAMERWRAWDTAGRPEQDGPRIAGVDVARSGKDKSVVAVRHGDVIVSITAFPRGDLMETTGRVKAILDRDPECRAMVDVIGLGAGVYDRLREQGMKADPFNAARKTTQKDKTGQFGFVNCLTGDARVVPVGEAFRIYRSRYEGPMFRVKMASGDEFTTTPHHNVLTPGGWVPVKALNAGDELCDASSGERVTAGQPDVGDMPPTISEVYRAAHIRSDAERVSGAAVNFHGDRPMGEVEVVPVDSELFMVNPSGRQHRADREFVGLLHGSRDLAGGGGIAQPAGLLGDERGYPDGPLPDFVMPGRPGAVIGVRELARTQAVGRRKAAPLDAMLLKGAAKARVRDSVLLDQRLTVLASGVPGSDFGGIELMDDEGNRLGSAPKRNAAFGQDSADHGSLDSEVLAERMHGCARQVSRNEIISVESHRDGEPGRLCAPAWLNAVFAEDRVNGGPVSPETLAERSRRFAVDVPLNKVVSIERTAPATGHEAPFVYTLETSTGAYQTSSIVHRNCRSYGWFHLADMLNPAYGPTLAFPPDDELAGDLTSLHKKFMSDGRVMVEPKDDVRKRIGRSTDRGDAVMQSCYGASGSWHDAYGTMICPSCTRPFLREADGKPRTECPHCRTSLDETEGEAA